MRSIVLAASVSLLAAACTGGADGGSPKRYGSGVHDFDGVCRDDFDTHAFRIDTMAGTFRMHVMWDETDDADHDLYVEDPDDEEGLFEGDDASPPGDSPAQVVVNVPAMDLLATVECFLDATGVEYSGRITVP